MVSSSEQRGRRVVTINIARCRRLVTGVNRAAATKRSRTTRRNAAHRAELHAYACSSSRKRRRNTRDRGCGVESGPPRVLQFQWYNVVVGPFATSPAHISHNHHNRYHRGRAVCVCVCVIKRSRERLYKFLLIWRPRESRRREWI